MFAASGNQQDLAALRALIEPVLVDPIHVADIIARADAAGFVFDD